MKKTYQITDAGRQELEAELEELKGRRGEIAEKIAEARDYGDLSEKRRALPKSRRSCSMPSKLPPQALVPSTWAAPSPSPQMLG